MTAQSRPNLGGLFDGSTPADRTSSIAGRLGPRLVTTPIGRPREQSAPESSRVEPDADVKEVKVESTPPPRTSESASQRIDPLAWIDPIKALESYFGVLQAALDANRQFVMAMAGALLAGGTRLRSGLDSIRIRP